jgi:hypothetical protein
LRRKDLLLPAAGAAAASVLILAFSTEGDRRV